MVSHTFFRPCGNQAEEDEEGEEKSERLHDDGAVNAAEPRMNEVARTTARISRSAQFRQWRTLRKKRSGAGDPPFLVQRGPIDYAASRQFSASFR